MAAGGRGATRRTAAVASIVSCGDTQIQPGPTQEPLSMVTANVTSLLSQFEAVTQLPGTVLALQETRMGEVAQRAMQGRLLQRGWQVLWGKPQPMIAGLRTASAWNAVPGGVAILVREGTPARTVPPSAPAEQALGHWAMVSC